jgi:hypothetical protein
MLTGTKLDEKVALHVLEWEKRDGRWFEPDSDAETPLKPFSSELSVAWDLAEQVCDTGYRLQIDGSRLWQARFYKSAAHTLETRAFAATAGTPAEAICLAALALKGVDTSK